MSRSITKSYLTGVLTNASRARLRSSINGEVGKNESIRTGIHRIPGLSEVNAVADANAKKPMHHYVFCSHNIPYWRTCTKCGRDKKLASANAEMILKSAHNLVK